MLNFVCTFMMKYCVWFEILICRNYRLHIRCIRLGYKPHGLDNRVWIPSHLPASICDVPKLVKELFDIGIWRWLGLFIMRQYVALVQSPGILYNPKPRVFGRRRGRECLPDAGMDCRVIFAACHYLDCSLLEFLLGHCWLVCARRRLENQVTLVGEIFVAGPYHKLIFGKEVCNKNSVLSHKLYEFNIQSVFIACKIV